MIKNSTLTIRLLMVIAAIAGLIIFIRFYPYTFPETLLNTGISREETLRLSETMLALPELGVPPVEGPFVKETKIKTHEGALRYLQEHFGLESSLRYIRDSVPVYRWQVRWINRLDSTLGGNFQIGVTTKHNDEDDRTKDNKRPLTMEFDLNGRLRYFESRYREFAVPIGDSSDIQNELPVYKNKLITTDSARETIRQFLKKIGYDDHDQFVEKTATPARSGIPGGYYFVYTNKQPIHGFEHSRVFRIRHDRIVYFEDVYELSREEGTNYLKAVRTVREIIETIAIFILSIIILVSFFRRFRKGALDLPLGMFYGVVTGVVFGVMFFPMAMEQPWWILAIVIVFAGLFWFLISGISVTVSASAAYEVWPDKYKTFEALRQGRIMNRRFGTSLMDALLFAMILSGILMLIVHFTPGTSVMVKDEIMFVLGPTQALYILTSTLLTLLLIMHPLYLLVLSLIRRKSENPLWIWIAGIGLGLLFPLILGETMPLAARLVISFVLGAALTGIFLQRDFLTMFMTAWLLMILFQGWLIVLSGDILEIGMLTGVFVIILGTAIAGILSRESGEDILDYTPEYVRAMENKQRMEREFEIARDIQTTMLCRSIPKNPFLEIATVCEPAYEVGGDYYDFIVDEHSSDRVGIVIGDVAGKGVSAAFHMTLIKGILQTQAAITTESPKETLCRVNDVYYHLIRRDKFISMIYAVFDFRRGEVRLARAGHNPLMMVSSSDHTARTLLPKGIALGLKKGKAFCEFLEEVTLRLRGGDVFVFYTDGFSEAMNRQGEEYGDERLEKIIRQSLASAPQDIVRAVREDVLKFTGHVPQHDDMTMIVVKIR